MNKYICDNLLIEILSYLDTNSLLQCMETNHKFYSFVKNLENNNSWVLRININRWLEIFKKSSKLYIIDCKYYLRCLSNNSFIKEYPNIKEIKLENSKMIESNFVDSFPNLKKLILKNCVISIHWLILSLSHRNIEIVYQHNDQSFNKSGAIYHP